MMAVALALSIAGCTTAPRQRDDTVSTTQPRASVTVVDQTGPAERAEAMSRALFASSSVVVIAPIGDPAHQKTAARLAERWGIPLLLAAQGSAETPAPAPSASSTTSPASESAALRSELTRLHTTTVATVGDVGKLDAGSARVVRSEKVTRPRPVSSGSTASVQVIATLDPTNLAAVATARAAGATVVQLAAGESNLQAAPDAITALHSSTAKSTILVGSMFQATSNPTWSVAAAKTGFQWAAGGQSLFPANRFVALYGTPGVPSLGVLGEQGLPQTIVRAEQVAAPYEALSNRKVTPMLEILATVAAGSAGADGDYSNEVPISRIEPYVDAAAAAHMPVVLDLQPGRSDFLTQAKKYESLLVKPNVGLALDPEWRLGPSQLPLKQIGSVSAQEVNAVSSWLAALVDQHGLPPKMFVLHQFRLGMLRDRDQIVTTHPELATVIHVDGQGSQPDKQATWKALHVGAPEGIAWGWKNFYDEDRPMLTPSQTMTEVSPAPDLITYQ